jgi:sulfoacetaldehyde dehydrogenase
MHAAYSSGTPAYGVGAGNADQMSPTRPPDIEEAARNTRMSETPDFGSAAPPTATC